MADLTKQGHYRTRIALAKLAELDHEATGQHPKPYKPRRSTKNPPVVRPALAWLMSLPMEQAKRERQRKAERRAYDGHRSHTMGDDWDVAVIIRSSRRSRCIDWAATIGVLTLVIVVLAAVGGGTG